jgi:hypothetical protein
LSELSTTEYQIVTMQYLKHVSDIVNEPSPVVQTYGEAFQVLEFLATARAVELVPLDGEQKQYKIRKL